MPICFFFAPRPRRQELTRWIAPFFNNLLEKSPASIPADPGQWSFNLKMTGGREGELEAGQAANLEWIGIHEDSPTPPAFDSPR